MKERTKQFSMWALLLCGVLAGVNALRAATEAVPDANGKVTIANSGSFELRQDVRQVVVSDGNANSVLEVTLDLNGHSVSNSNTTTLLVDNYENLLLTNSSTTVWSYIDGLRVTKADAGRGIYNRPSATLHFGGQIIVRNCRSGQGGAVFTEGTFVMTGGQLGEDLGEMTDNTNWSNWADSTGGNIYGTANSDNTPSVARVTITGGTICNGYSGLYGGGMCVWYKCHTTISGSARFIHNRGKCGGGIEVGNGTSLTIDGKDVVIAFNRGYGNGDHLSGGGVAIGLDTGVNTLIMNAGNIVSNLAEGANLGGGGIFMRGEGSGSGALYLNGGRVADNESKGFGGGIYAYGDVSIDGCEVVRNLSVKDGGGIYMSKDRPFVIFSGSVSSNMCSQGNGGGLYAIGSVTVSNGWFIGNRALKVDANGGQGGGLFKRQAGAVVLEGGEIADNYAQDSGGGIYTQSPLAAPFTINDGRLRRNLAENDGGGIYAKSVTVTVNGGEVTGNEAHGNGGGFFTTDSSVSLLKAVTVADNRANGNGGGLAINGEGKVIKLEGGSIERNIAQGNGGGVWLTGRGDTTDSHIGPANAAELEDASKDIHVRFNKARNGGGIYMQGGAWLNVQGGYICNNVAVGDPNADFTTASYPTTDTQRGKIEGCGGGIYVSGASAGTSNRTALEFKLSADTAVGIYANVASNAADDILAEGLNATKGYTRIKGIPLGTDMHLDQLAGARVWGWYEDYHIADSQYVTGTSTYRLGVQGTNGRFRPLFATGTPEEIEAVKVDSVLAPTTVDYRYFCLTLGYTIPQPTLWIADHADAGAGKVHLAVCLNFPGGAKLTPDLVQQIAPQFWAVASTSATTDEDFEKVPESERIPVALRDPKGELDIERGWIWLTVPFSGEPDTANYLLKIVYSPE